jgi:hypothetical protein
MFNSFFFENRAVYEIMCRILYNRMGHIPQNKTAMRFGYWINKTTNIHSEYVIPIAFPQQKVLDERASK